MWFYVKEALLTVYEAAVIITGYEGEPDPMTSITHDDNESDAESFSEEGNHCDADNLPGQLPADMTVYSLHEIYHISFLLRQKLIPDIISQILHDANIFYCQTASLAASSEHGSTDIEESTSPHAYLCTDPIKSSARLVHPVRKVVFTIESRDQGWATGPGTWTWFTAAVRPRESAEAEPNNLPTNRSTGQSLAWEKEIIRNKRGSGTFQHYVVTWSADAEKEEENHWVQNLSIGDEIAVRAWARYPGWVNKIRSVKIEIFMAAII